MFSNLKGWEWLIIVALILLLFGAKRLPDAARGLGRSLRIFKAETKGLTESSDSPADSTARESLSAQESKAVTSSEKGPRASESSIADPEER
jgi:sec-independent protein translocase protein TatA